MYRSGCPLASALDVVGDKWSLIIIRDIFIERSTFKEFLAGPEGIASNILSQRLKWLREQDIIDFAYKKGNQKVKYYYLTDKGIDLYPCMYEIMAWSQKISTKNSIHILLSGMKKINTKAIKSKLEK